MTINNQLSYVIGGERMIFRDDIEPCCAYCKYGTQVSIDRVACIKRGIVPLYGACRRFSYDPLKRQPERPRKFSLPEDGSGDVFQL